MARLNTLVGLALLAALCAGAADSDMDRGTLQGLKALRVVVDAPKPETERDGLNTTDLKAQLEAKLRDAGIVVDEGANDFLGLTITSAKDRKNYAVSLGLGVYQVVVLRRDPKIKTVRRNLGHSDGYGDQREKPGPDRVEQHVGTCRPFPAGLQRR